MYHSILELPTTATPSEIKQRYKKLAKQWHPDKHLGKSAKELETINDKFNKITTAYNRLICPDTKAQYDIRQSCEDVDTAYTNRFNVDTKQNIRVEIDVPLRTIYQNVRQRIDYQFKKRCMRCMGKGYVDVTNPDKCLDCQGAGCPTCGGIGRYVDPEHICPDCRGAKYLVTPSYFTYNFNNNTLRDNMNNKLQYSYIVNSGSITYDILQKGNESEFGTGNLIFTANILPDKHFTLRDKDIHVKKTISLADAILGSSYHITLPNGISLIVENTDKIIRPNQNLIIDNFGIVKNNEKGNLIIEFEIDFPKHLNSNDRTELGKILGHTTKRFNTSGNVVVTI